MGRITRAVGGLANVLILTSCAQLPTPPPIGPTVLGIGALYLLINRPIEDRFVDYRFGEITPETLTDENGIFINPPQIPKTIFDKYTYNGDILERLESHGPDEVKLAFIPYSGNQREVCSVAKTPTTFGILDEELNVMQISVMNQYYPTSSDKTSGLIIDEDRRILAVYDVNNGNPFSESSRLIRCS